MNRKIIQGELIADLAENGKKEMIDLNQIISAEAENKFNFQEMMKSLWIMGHNQIGILNILNLKTREDIN